MSEFDCVPPNESSAIVSAIQNGDCVNEKTVLDLRGADDKHRLAQQNSQQSMEEIDFEKELMAIRASEDDEEIEGVVSNSRSTPNLNNNSAGGRNNDSMGGGNFDSNFLNSNDSGGIANVMGRSDSIDDDELRQLLQESDTEGEQQLLGRQKSSSLSIGGSSSVSRSRKDTSFHDDSMHSSIPDVTMPPDGIIENDDGTFSCYVIVPAGNSKQLSPFSCGVFVVLLKVLRLFCVWFVCKPMPFEC